MKRQAVKQVTMSVDKASENGEIQFFPNAPVDVANSLVVLLLMYVFSLLELDKSCII